jgi:anhydro-N-acetylmuramic acid kinase
MTKYKVIGLMSGTSLDGLDIAFCEFELEGRKWQYSIHHAETIPYSKSWQKKLSMLNTKSKSIEIAKINVEYGQLIGKLSKNFIIKHNIKPQFISSHGHTIFHQPENKLTLQIGHGASIAAETNLPVVCDFRSIDVALGGQGAPLVPIGDKLLFPEFNFCLNLGGFANISFEKNKKRIAFDICPVNTILNMIAKQTGQDYDKDGNLARQGSINENLLTELNNIDFYNHICPKSLGKEWLYNNFFPLINKYNINHKDKLRTLTEHIAIQISKIINLKPSNQKILVTGGGTYNKFLIETIKAKTKNEIVIPANILIDYKEALIFAFLGVLRFRNKINTLNSVTGASKQSIGGAIYFHY